VDLDTFVDQLRSILTADIPKPANPYDSLYDDLSFDSFQAFELLIVVESLAGNVVPPEEIPELYTLADAYEYYQSLRAAEAETLDR
jgi:acyl carrier protein